MKEIAAAGDARPKCKQSLTKLSIAGAGASRNPYNREQTM